ncbi:hypothetical protein vseg_015093 [Gypsophila vaccaria]
MNAIKGCLEQLALFGKTLDPEDVISKVLKGLDYEEYKPVLDAVRARDNPISFETLNEKLLHHELLLKQQLPTNTFPPTANPSYRHTNRGYNHLPAPSPQPTTAHTTPPRQFKGRCQWCRQVGHVIAAYFAFRKLHPSITFSPPPSRQTTAPPQAHTAAHNNSTPTLNIY